MAEKLSPTRGCPVQPEEANAVVVVFTVLQGADGPVLVPLCPALSRSWSSSFLGANSSLTPLYYRGHRETGRYVFK